MKRLRSPSVHLSDADLAALFPQREVSAPELVPKADNDPPDEGREPVDADRDPESRRGAEGRDAKVAGAQGGGEVGGVDRRCVGWECGVHGKLDERVKDVVVEEQRRGVVRTANSVRSDQGVES